MPSLSSGDRSSSKNVKIRFTIFTALSRAQGRPEPAAAVERYRVSRHCERSEQSRGNEGTLATTRLLRRVAPRNDGAYPAAIVASMQFKTAHWAAASTERPKLTITETKPDSVTPSRAGAMGWRNQVWSKGCAAESCHNQMCREQMICSGFGGRRSVRFFGGFQNRGIGMRPRYGQQGTSRG